MKISEIGGEFALIERLSTIVAGDREDVVVGIGDDAAVLRTAPPPGPYLLVTTDVLVSGRHFSDNWSTPMQIGIKAAACNISDIAAMGGQPTWMFVSLVLSGNRNVQWVQDLYLGLNQSCRRHHAVVAGGDTSLGDQTVISITLLGSVGEHELCLRRHARPGDWLVTTGQLGASAAALALLNAGRRPSQFLMEKHLTPVCRLDASRHIAPLAHAMIDISDGLASEVNHICTQSKVSAEIEAAAIPLHHDVIEAGNLLGVDPLNFALSGGEDYELLFTIAPERWQQLARNGLDLYRLGQIVSGNEKPVMVHSDGSRSILPSGYNHFTA
jgi:thiamine-monophosphate kinase